MDWKNAMHWTDTMSWKDTMATQDTDTKHPSRKWPWRMRARYIWAITYRVFWLGDTLPIRVLMAVASIVFALTILIYPETFDRKAFSGMGALVRQFHWGDMIGPGPIWAFFFTIHGIGVFWRIWDPVKRIYWALTINWLGWLLWCTEIVETCVSLHEIAAGNALEIAAVVALFIALVRTGLNDEKVNA